MRLGIYWQDVEPNPGQFDFAADDALVASTGANKMNVLAILAYSTTWSTSAPADPSDNVTHYPPRDYRERQPTTSPRWCREMQATFTTGEVWNQPDLTEFWNGMP